jgi:lysophospholipase L1-like esterase
MLPPAPPEVDQKRLALNQFFRTPGLFDGLFDFDAATLDPATGELKAEYQPNSTTGGPGDKLHPNRAGYAAMASAINLKPFVGHE